MLKWTTSADGSFPAVSSQYMKGGCFLQPSSSQDFATIETPCCNSPAQARSSCLTWYVPRQPHSKAGGVKIMSIHRLSLQAADLKEQSFPPKAVSKPQLWENKALSISTSNKCPTAATQGNIYASRQGRKKSSFVILERFPGLGCCYAQVCYSSSAESR